MAGSKSDYWENRVLDLVLGGSAYTAPGTVHIALYTAAPSDAGGGTEVTGGSYSRAAVTNNLTNWPAASGGAKSNANAITFGTATAAWGTVVAFGLFDDPSAGNLIYWADLTANKVVGSGDVAQFNANDLDVTED